MMQEDLPIVIVECCCNCKYHVWCTRHNEWKYTQHFNEIKRKVQKSIRQAVVVRNPTPDNLVKLDDPSGQQNKYFNEETEEVVVFPRLGAFEIYLYDVLIFSKLQSNQWPQHNRLLEKIQNMVDDRFKGLDLQKYSVENGQDDVKLESIAPKLPMNQTSFKSMEVQRIQPAPQSIEVDQVRLPPATKLYRKIFKSYDKEKPLDKSAGALPIKLKKRSSIPKVQQQPRKGSIEINGRPTSIPREKDINGSLPIIVVNDGEPREAMRTDKSTFTDAARTLGLRTEDQPLRRGSQQQQNESLGFGSKNAQPLSIEIHDRIIRSEQMVRPEDQPELADIDSEKVLQEFSKDFNPIRVKDLDRGSMQDSRQGKRHLPIRQRMKLAQVVNQIVSMPKEKTIVHVGHFDVNKEIIQERAARLPRLRIKKEYEEVLNKEIIDEKNSRPMKIAAQLSMDVNKEIIEEVARRPVIYYDNTEIQMTEHDYEDNGQQIEIILQTPDEYAKECFEAGVQAVDTLNDIAEEDYSHLIKRSVSVQMSYIDQAVEEVLVEDHGVQMNIEKDERAMNTETPVRNFTSVGMNTMEVEVIEKVPQPEPVEDTSPKPIEDVTFTALKEPRKAIPDNQGYHSIERFQHKDSKYRWTGRALKQPEEQTLLRYNKEKLLFALYKLIGINTANKQLSRQLESNVVPLPGHPPAKPELLMHVLTEDIPDIKFMTLFSEHSFGDNQLVKADSATLRQSKSAVKLEGYGKLLAAAKFLNDLELFSADHQTFGFEIIDGLATNFTKLSISSYDQEERSHDCPNRTIQLSVDGSRSIKFDDLSDKIKLQFITELKRISNLKLPTDIMDAISSTEVFPDRQSFEKVFGKGPEQFANFLLLRRDALCNQEFGVQLRMFTRFGSLKPTIAQYWLNTIFLVPHVLSNNKRVPLQQCIRQWYEEEEHKIMVVKSPSSIGKTSTLVYLKKHIESTFRTDCMLIDLKNRPTLQELRAMQKQLKNCMTLLVNNYEKSEHIQELLKLFSINLYPNKRLVLTSDTSNYVEETVSGVFILAGLEELVEECELVPFDDKQITEFIGKHIELHGVPKGVEKEAIEKQVMRLDESRRVISSPSLLNFVMHFLAELIRQQQPLSKFGLLKTVINKCNEDHKQLCNILGRKYVSTEEYLKNVALALFKDRLQEVPESQFPDYQNFSQGRYINNLLELFPLVRNNSKLSFHHSNFTHYFVCIAMSEIVEKGYKGIELSHITRSREVIHLLKEKYSIRGGENRLLEIIDQSKSNVNLAEQASNAVTLLSKIGFIFSDLSFEGAQFPHSDLSFSVMYNTNFRGANLDGASIFNCHMTECVLDGCSINALDMGLRKYVQDKEIYSGALSQDGKYVGVSYGNNLLLLHSENGKQYKMLTGHTDLVKEVFFSRDGQSVVSIADDRSIRIWNLKTFSPIVLKVPSKVGIKFNPEAEKICCITKDTVRIWSIRLMGGEVTLKGHTDEVKHVDFSSNGQRVVTSSKDKTVMLWNIEGDFLKAFHGHEAEVHYSAISPNGKFIASASADNTIRMWDIGKGQQSQIFNFSSKISRFRYSPEEKYLIVAGADDFSIKALNLKTGQEAFAFTGHEDQILSLDFDKLGEKIISVSGDQTVRVWNFQKFRETQFLEGHPEQVWSVGASRFNDFFVSGSADNTVKLWDSKTGDELRTFEGHTGEVFSVAFSPLGKKAASGGEDKKVIMWDIMTGEKLHVSNYHSDWVHCVLFSNDGYMLASSDASGLLVIWDVYVDKVKLKVDAHDGQLFSLCFNSTNDHIATSGADSKIKIFEISTGKELHTFEGHEGNVWNVKYLTDDRLVSGAKDGVVIVWNIQTGQIINKLKNESSVQCIAIISSDRVAFSLENGTIRVVDITSSREIKSFHNAEPIWSIDIGKDRNRLISAGGDNTVRIWSLSETKEKFTLKFGTLVFNRNASISANLVNHKQITITDLVEHRETQHHLPDDLVQVVSFTANDNLILLKDDNTYSEYDLRRREQQLVSNINQYNISSADLLLCKGKFARTFDKCSFKKMRGANEEFLQLFQDS